MKKKIIILSFFLLIILVTVVGSITAAIESYKYDMDPANGVDILEGVGAGIAIAIGMIAVFVEVDIFFTVYYFLVKPKTMLKSILIIVSQLMIILVFFSDKISHLLFKYVSDIFREEMFVIIPIFFFYVISRMICITIAYLKKNRVFFNKLCVSFLIY